MGWGRSRARARAPPSARPRTFMRSKLECVISLKYAFMSAKAASWLASSAAMCASLRSSTAATLLARCAFTSSLQRAILSSYSAANCRACDSNWKRSVVSALSLSARSTRTTSSWPASSPCSTTDRSRRSAFSSRSESEKPRIAAREARSAPPRASTAAPAFAASSSRSCCFCTATRAACSAPCSDKSTSAASTSRFRSLICCVSDAHAALRRSFSAPRRRASSRRKAACGRSEPAMSNARRCRSAVISGDSEGAAAAAAAAAGGLGAFDILRCAAPAGPFAHPDLEVTVGAPSSCSLRRCRSSPPTTNSGARAV